MDWWLWVEPWHCELICCTPQWMWLQGGFMAGGYCSVAGLNRNINAAPVSAIWVRALCKHLNYGRIEVYNDRICQQPEAPSGTNLTNSMWTKLLGTNRTTNTLGVPVVSSGQQGLHYNLMTLCRSARWECSWSGSGFKWPEFMVINFLPSHNHIVSII